MSLGFPHVDPLALHNKFPIMTEQLTLQVAGHVLLDEVNFQLPLGKK
jgi:macrolide transport system ATP-binding/permease protein